MCNLFKQPFEKETLADWAKMMADICKVAILAIPVILYGNDASGIKIINSFLLIVGAYGSAFISRYIRKIQEQTITRSTL